MARDAARGENEALFREVNERVESAAQRLPDADERFAFVCECSDETCAEEIELRVEEYERVRSVPTWFSVHPGHVEPEIEVVVERRDGYWIVEKTDDDAVAVAERTDPR